MIAGAASMAAGEWISMTAQREALEQELAREQDHLDRYPEDERSHIEDILVKAGLTADTASRVSSELSDKPRENLDFHARVELGIDPEELGSPVLAAGVSFVAFAIGALVPLIPWLLPLGTPMLLTGLFSGLALFAAGAGLSRFTPRGVLYSGTRQLLVGVVAAALTMTIGGMVGVSV